MPSRHLLSPPPPPHHLTHLLPPLAGGLTAAFSCLLLLVLCFRRITKKRAATATVPAASPSTTKKPPHPLNYSLLRRATSNFSATLRLGQGGFGSVYRAHLSPKDSIFTPSNVAVKVMDAGSLQGEREFQNELLISSKIDCKYVVPVLGFSSNSRKRRMVLVYELMENGSLQDCLFHKKSVELKNWGSRFGVALSVAKGLEYLHHYCDPPIIHGDIKPSNVLLDGGFNARIGDFGLARFKAEDNNILEVEVKKEDDNNNDNGSNMETESVITTSAFEEVNSVSANNNLGGIEMSPESVVVRVEASPSDGFSEGNFDRFSVESGGEREKNGSNKKNKKKKSVTGKDWWWKQDEESGKVKDYVMEWIGTEIKKERPSSEWIGTSSNVKKPDSNNHNNKKKKKKRQLDWWVSLDEEKNAKKPEKRRPAREWWKEEYCEELEKKKKKNKKKKNQNQESLDSISDDCYSEKSWYTNRSKKKRSRSRSSRGGSRGSMDKWLEGFSGEIPKSGNISSTPSMRGTVCYIAPEYGGGGADVSEKCDVYSFGVLLLVVIAGRRPLQVTGSPMSEFQRANLLSWARHLARAGKLLDLVDRNLECLDEEKVVLCITVALLCLQKLPTRRPSMKEVVGILSGDLAAPGLPVEFSPSPKYRGPLKSSHKKAR